MDPSADPLVPDVSRTPGRGRSLALEETFAAIVIDWDALAIVRTSDAAAIRVLIEGLCAHGTHVILVSTSDVVGLGALLGVRPTTHGHFLLYDTRNAELFEARGVGSLELIHRRPGTRVEDERLTITSKTDAVNVCGRWLANRGITGALILVIGEDFHAHDGTDASAPNSPIDELERAVIMDLRRVLANGETIRQTAVERLTALLEGQLERHRDRRVPPIDPDPRWVLTLPTSRDAERVAEALGALSNGWAGTRASLEENDPGSSPLFSVEGVYDERDELLPGPTWTDLDLPASTQDAPLDTRVLDLHTGVLARNGDAHSGVRSIRFASATAPHALAFRAEFPRILLEGKGGEPSSSPSRVSEQPRTRVRVTSSEPEAQVISIAMSDRSSELDGRDVVERLASWSNASDETVANAEALATVRDLDIRGFETLLAEHRESWAQKWADGAVSIEGDPGSELAARFAIFHLLCAAKNIDEAAVGARGLTGNAYAGHVFWDADVFVLPALCALAPDSARAMLEYRWRRLPEARRAAERLHRRGARFPWESAASGVEVCPTKVKGVNGELVVIRTGTHEEHIVADVAWAAAHYTAWTGDPFFEGEGLGIVSETARYWASRIRVDRDGTGHIYGVMGPDEYHQIVDDNMFTNVMARWNLRAAASLERSGASEETRRWRELADSLVDGYRHETKIYEQFAGYFGLEPLLVAQFARPPVPIDVVLGAQRVAQSQLIKQADVVMAHHLIPSELQAGSLLPCLDFYEPRTAHGSSLSPAISASLFAQAGDPDRALEYFDLAARVDLDDLTKTTAGGVHLAAMGGLWQALAHGFLGLRADGAALRISPHLPQRWSSLSMNFRFRSQRLALRAEHDRISITCTSPLMIKVCERRMTVKPPGATLTLDSPQSNRSTT